MADMYFKERCPCGNSVDISGYRGEVQAQIQAWRRIHNPHANAIAKQIALNWKWPLLQVNPPGSSFFDFGIASNTEAQKSQSE